MTLIRTASAIAVLSVALASPALAQREPTLSDIAGCNEQAAARTGASALPHPGGSTEVTQRGPSAAPRDKAGSPGIVPGPADPGVGNVPKPGPAPMRTPGSAAPGEKTDPSGSVITETPDPLVRGMDASKADDPQYRAAYRDCMRAKLRS
jgi:hypothetical protein